MRKLKLFVTATLIAAMVISGIPTNIISNITDVRADTENELQYKAEQSETTQNLEGITAVPTTFVEPITDEETTTFVEPISTAVPTTFVEPISTEEPTKPNETSGVEEPTRASERIYYRDGDYIYNILADGTIRIDDYYPVELPEGFVRLDLAVVPSQIDGRDVTCIGASAFRNCRSVVDIIIPNSVTTIEDYAFEGTWACVHIPSGITSIGKWAFYQCSGGVLVRGSFYGDALIISEGVTEIKEGVFSECSEVQGVVIPNGVTRIEKQAFAGCSSLKSITIPDTVAYIGEKAFTNCTALTYVKIPVNTVVAENAFEGCTQLQIEYETEEVTTEQYTTELASVAEPTKQIEPTTTVLATSVNVKGTKFKSVKAKKKALNLKWKKVKGVQGYQIQYGKKKNFSNAKTKTIANAASTELNLKNLKANKNYYVRIRTYRLVKGEQYYSAWSAVKKRKTKA